MINFDPVKHEYTSKGRIYDSVTKVISLYENPFDSQYWSVYKACKDVIIEQIGEKDWKLYKREAGGWDKVPSFYKAHGHELHKEIQARKAYYLNLWYEKKVSSALKGTAVHAAKEKEVKSHKHVSSSVSGATVSLTVSSGQLLAEQNFVDDRVYAELIISNDHFHIAGTADIVEKHGKVIHILDYKTSEEIDRHAFMDATMKFPLQSLPDCNYYHFTMQFSTYAWMLSELGYTVGSLTLEHLLPPDYKEKVNIPITYRPDLVELMLKHYRGEELPKLQTDRQAFVDLGTNEKTFNFG